MTGWKPKSVTDIPPRLHQEIWGHFDKDKLHIFFWAGDEEANLFLYFSPEELTEIEDYGVSNELIDWMREENMFTTDTFSVGVEDYEIYTVTDEVIADFFLKQSP